MRKTTLNKLLQDMEELKLDAVDGYVNAIPIPIQLLLNMPSGSTKDFCNILETAMVTGKPVTGFARLRLDVIIGHTEFHTVYALREPISFFEIPGVNVFWKDLVQNPKTQLIVSHLFRGREEYFMPTEHSVLKFPAVREMWLNVRRDFRLHFARTDTDSLYNNKSDDK